MRVGVTGKGLKIRRIRKEWRSIRRRWRMRLTLRCD